MIAAILLISLMENVGSTSIAPLAPSAAPVPDMDSTTPKNQIDTIDYLASLASRPTDIDPLLEPVRFITARLNPGETPSQADHQVLAEVQRKLERYLIEQEPLRRFTPESLKQKMIEHASGYKARGLTHLIVFWVATAVILACLPFLFFPNQNADLKQTASAISLLSGFCLAAAWLFATSVRDFKLELRAAYRLIAVGVVIYGAAMLVQPLRTFTGTSDLEWRHLEIIIIPFLLSHLPIYAGLRAFTRQLGVQTNLIQPLLLICSLLAGGLLVVLLPHIDTLAEEIYFDISVVALAWCGIIASINASIMFLLSRRIGDLYAGPMRWLLAGYVAISIAVWEFLILRFIVGYLPPGPIQLISFLPTLIGGILLFVAAVKFKRASLY